MTYAQIRATNWSLLKLMGVSPLHFRHRQQNPQQTTAAMALGSAIHCAVLEPDQYQRQYVVYSDRRAGSAWKSFQAAHLEYTILSEAEQGKVDGASAALWLHPSASAILSARGDREQILQWTDSETGIKCKGRADLISDRVVDLKTTGDLDQRRFGGTMARFQYYGQVAFYHDGALAEGRDLGQLPVLVVVEQDPPHDVAVVPVDPDSLEMGRRIYRGYLEQLAACRESDQWPGRYPDPVQMRDLLPAWAGLEDDEPVVTMGGKPITF